MIDQRDSLIIKGVHRCESRGYVDLIVTSLDEDLLARHESVPLVGLEADWLDRTARRLGANRVEIFGDYQQHAYDRATSVDLLLVAAK